MALIGGNIGFTGYQQPNYAGVVEAAGLPMQAIGQGIAQAQDYFKQQGEKKKLIKKSDVQIDAALKLFPDLAPTLQGVRDQIKDENISLDERAGIAESVAGLINMGTNQMQAMADYGLKKRQLDIQEGQGIQSALMEQAKMQAEANKPIKMKPDKAVVDGLEVDVLRDDYGSVYDPQTKSRILDLPGYATGKPLEQVTEQFDASRLPAAYGGTIPTDTGMVLPEKQSANVPVLSREAQAAADIAGAAYPDGIPVEGTPIAAEVAQTPIDKALALTPRGRSTKQEQKETQMTSSQVQSLVAQGFKVNARPLADGSFMVSGTDIGGQPGETIETTPEGGFRIVRGGPVKAANEPAVKLGEGQQLVPDPTSPTGTRVVNIPGGKAEQQAQQEEAAKELTKARGLEQASVALDEIDRFIEYTGKMSKLPFASPARRLMATAGMEQQSEAESSLDTVKANLKFEALDALRKASPSGASGLGQVTQNEFSALADQWGTLRLVGDPEKIQERALSIKRKLLDTVHGNQAHRDAMLKKGVITPQQYNDIQSQYPNGKQVTSEDARIDRFRKVFSTQPTQ